MMPSKLIPFPPRPANEDAFHAPPFDPNNRDHVRAWNALWDFGQYEARRRERASQREPNV